MNSIHTKSWLVPFGTSCLLHILPLAGILSFFSLPHPQTPQPAFFLAVTHNSLAYSPMLSTQKLKVSPSPASAAPIFSSPPSPTNTTLETSYAAEVRQALEQHKFYPPHARSLGQSGRVLLQFEVKQDGTISHFSLVEKSPFSSLNEAAVGLLQSLKLPPIPQDLQRVSWQFTFPLEYRLD